MDFLCLDFINCCFGKQAGGEPAPVDAHGVRQLCLKWGLPEPGKSIPASLARLRETLCHVIRDYIESGAISASKLDALNAYLLPVSFHTMLERSDTGFHIREIPERAEDTLLPYRVVMSFADLVGNHDARRLKICENPDCGWVFHDESKSRTRRWCDNTCASLIKVRRFREKNAAS